MVKIILRFVYEVFKEVKMIGSFVWLGSVINKNMLIDLLCYFI